jgi:hypothetical protein
LYFHFSFWGLSAVSSLLFQYVIGKPAMAVNPDTLDVQEFREVYAPRKEIMELGPQVVQGLPPRVLSMLVDIVNDACAEQFHKLMSLPPEQVAEATKNLAAFFPGAQSPAPTPAAAANQADDSDPLVAEINRLVYGPHEDDEEDQDEGEDELNDVEQAPSTNGRKGVNRPSAARPRPSRNGDIGPALKNSTQRGPRKQRGGPPSTNGGAATKGDDRKSAGRRRYA